MKVPKECKLCIDNGAPVAAIKWRTFKSADRNGAFHSYTGTRDGWIHAYCGQMQPAGFVEKIEDWQSKK